MAFNITGAFSQMLALSKLAKTANNTRITSNAATIDQMRKDGIAKEANPKNEPNSKWLNSSYINEALSVEKAQQNLESRQKTLNVFRNYQRNLMNMNNYNGITHMLPIKENGETFDGGKDGKQ